MTFGPRFMAREMLIFTIIPAAIGRPDNDGIAITLLLLFLHSTMILL